MTNQTPFDCKNFCETFLWNIFKGTRRAQPNMASSTVRCSLCGVQLLVPPYSQTIRCAVCHGVTRGPTNDPVAQAYDSVRQAAKFFKGVVDEVSNSINTIVAPHTDLNNQVWVAPVYGCYPLPPAHAHGRKRALLCGINYKGKSYKLKGSVNDVKCMKYFLVDKMGFPSDCILVLTGDSLVFHFSGHGSQVRDLTMDEIDGYDETLCPVDYETEGMIIDDEINATIVRPLPPGAKLHAIIDACHSGTILDLRYVCRMNREGYYVWEDHSCASATYKGTNGGLAVSFSACDDHQSSADTKAFSGNTATGALTYSFIQAVQNEPGLTYGRLLNNMRHTIREAKTGLRLNGPIASLIRKAFFELSQVPQLSSSERFDIYSKSFVL
ncbi:hypothetical protein RJ641_018990 [Dillenia turbinata]|uniref:Peptidase C14 caspase domain-containing protein n=1 Tax=Dillenia turbinata TaxID=194707 RepID=A0AAN8UNQ1_9MAGN